MKKMRGSLRGQTLVEFALVLPVFILMVMMIADLGRGIFFYSVIYNAAREGARYGIIHPNETCSGCGIEIAARKLAIGLNPGALTVTPQKSVDAINKPVMKVTVTYSFNLITPLVGNFIGANPLTLRSISTMHLEQ